MKAFPTALFLACLLILPALSYGDPTTIYSWREFSEEYSDEPIPDLRQFDSVTAQSCKIVQDYEKYCSYGSVTTAQCLADYQRECGVPMDRDKIQRATDAYQQLCGDVSSVECRQSLSLLIASCPAPTAWEQVVPCPKVTPSNATYRRFAPKLK